MRDRYIPALHHHQKHRNSGRHIHASRYGSQLIFFFVAWIGINIQVKDRGFHARWRTTVSNGLSLQQAGPSESIYHQHSLVASVFLLIYAHVPQNKHIPISHPNRSLLAILLLQISEGPITWSHHTEQHHFLLWGSGFRTVSMASLSSGSFARRPSRTPHANNPKTSALRSLVSYTVDSLTPKEKNALFL